MRKTTSSHFVLPSFLGALLVSAFSFGLPSTAQAAASGASDNKNEDRFTFHVDAAKDVKKGKKTQVKVTMVPKGEWHMNMEFPTSLTLTPTKNAKLDSETKLKPKDAKVLDEHKGAEFHVEFTAPKSGEGTIDAKLKFAICIESACSPVTKKFKIDFKAK